MYRNSRLAILLPILLAAAVVLGLLLGRYLGRNTPEAQLRNLVEQLTHPTNKLAYTLSLIETEYVDSVSMDSLSEQVIPLLMEELDPHSVYIPKSEMEAVNEPLQGEFDGIGVVFNMATDTVIVLNVIPQGPSDKAGIKAGDRIIEINDTLVAGQKIPQRDVVKKLRGPRGTTVHLGLGRQGISDLVGVDVVRDKIPIKSVESAFCIADGIGYIKLGQFARTTFDEMQASLDTLRAQGATKLIFDLRGNSGGYLDQAIMVANEFLHKDQLIVYTEDRQHKQLREYADGTGAAQDMDVVVLIDEGSASSSEILAGALQDNDRGTIIGRRTYGKGLVQTQMSLSDGSEMRLTIARYYTPSGRCIQKKYEMGNTDAYDQDIYNRYMHGEFDSADSIKMDDSLKYQTVGGRTVYGGGGIMPDIFIPRDTSGVTSYYSNVVNSGVLYLYALEYSDRHREKLGSFKTWEELYNYLQQQPLLSDFVNFAATKGIKRRPTLINISGKLIENQLQAYIVRNFFDEAGFYPIFLKDDVTLLRAIKILQEGKSVPNAELLKQSANGDLHSQAGPTKRYGLSKERIFEDYLVRAIG